MQIRVLEVLDGERAVVSTRGLCRVLRLESGEPVAELLTPAEASSMAAHNARCYADGEPRLVVQPYSRTA